MSRKSFRASRTGGGGDWVTEMMRAILGDSGLDALSVSTEDAGKAVCKNVFPVVKKHISFIVEYNNANFEAALVDEITQGEGPISSFELLEKVKSATQRIKELTELVESQSAKMREMEANLAQANEFLEKVENVKEDALTSAEKCKEFAKKEEEKFPKANKEFLEQLRLEVRDEVALELAEQATAATAASNTETAEKEIQTDPVELGSAPASTADAVPVAPPPPATETNTSNQQLTAADRDLLHSCLDEIRSLTVLLSSHASGGPNAFQQGDVQGAGSRQGVSVRNSCVGTSEGVRGGHQGSVYEHVPLTTLRLSPICRAPPERSDLGSTRSILLSASLSPRGRLPLERPSEDFRNERGADLSALCPASEVAFAADGPGASTSASGVFNRPSAALETSTLQDTPQQQQFVRSHLVSAELPEEVSIHPTADFSLHGPCSPAEGSTGSLSLSREASAMKAQKPGGARAQGKLQISFADETILASDPPRSSDASPTTFNETESQTALASPEVLSAVGLHADAASLLPSEPKAVATGAGADAAGSAVLNAPRNDTSAVGTAAEEEERRSIVSVENRADSSAPEVQQQQQQQQAKEKRPDANSPEPNAASGGAAASISLSQASASESLISCGERQTTVQGEKYLTQVEQQPDSQQQKVQQPQPKQQPQEQDQPQQEEHDQQQQEQGQLQELQQDERPMRIDSSFCVPPEVIFGQHGPPIWPMVTGGPSWFQSHETKTIPLARLQRQIRGEFAQPAMMSVECTNTPLLICSEAGREQRCTEVSQELLVDGHFGHVDTSTAVYLPLKGSKLGSGTRKLPKKETKQTPEATCKTLNDLRIRNQVLESQVLGLSVALRQAHERLSTLTRGSDKLNNGMAMQK